MEPTIHIDTAGNRQRERKTCQRVGGRQGGKTLTPSRVKRFISNLLGSVNMTMDSHTSREIGGERTYDGGSSFEQNSCKEPLLVKAEAAEIRRHHADQDLAEARGWGTYALHAVLGQGSFGRIHLVSWRECGENVPFSASSSAVGGTDSIYVNSWNGNSDQAIAAASGGGWGDVARHGRTLVGGDSFGAKGGALPRGMGGGACSYVRNRHPSLPPLPQAGRATDDPISFGAGDEGGGCPAVAEYRALEQHREDARGGYPGQPQLRLRALKSVCKRKITEKGLIHHMETELEVLRQCSHPFIVSLRPGGYFQTSGHLHLVLDYCPGGDLHSLLGREGRLAEAQARVCAAQLALALRHLHSKHIAYRDLKPENVCLDSRGHAILVDFSLAKTGLDKVPGGKAFTFCGSAAYVAPEMLAKDGHDTRVDLWSLGCVMFEALTGSHPFRRPRGERWDRQEMFRKIRQGRPDYPFFLSGPAISLLQGLLKVNPDERLGFPDPAGRLTAAPAEQQDKETAVVEAPASAVEPISPISSSISASADVSAVYTDGESIGESVAKDCVWVQSAEQCADERFSEPTVIDGRNAVDCVVEMSASGILHGVKLDQQRMRANTSARVVGRDGKPERGMSLRTGAVKQSGTSVGATKNARKEVLQGEVNSTPPLSLLEHRFFRGLPGSGGMETGGAWEEAKLARCSIMSPELRDTLDVRHFDPRFTSQTVELVLQGHPHKGGPTPSFDTFDWRDDGCIEYAQLEQRRRRTPGFLGSMASAFWC